MAKFKLNDYETVVTSIKEIAPDVCLLTFKKKWHFLAGQVVGIALKGGDDPRMYSLSGGTDDKEGEIIFDVKPEGSLTPRLAKLKVGDKFFISEPFGEFTANEKPAWWIASGTGVAPFASMVRSGFTENKRLIQGGRFTYSFYFEDLFKKALGKNYIRCCSQETGEELYSGRVTSWLEEQTDLPKDVLYYICGNAEMVVDARDILIKKEIPYENIHSEIYF